MKHSLDARGECKTLKWVGSVGDRIPEGCIDFRKETENASADWQRPTGDEATKPSDPMLIYFSSGTSGMPKMILHDFAHPLGQIVTAKYWHREMCIRDRLDILQDIPFCFFNIYILIDS